MGRLGPTRCWLARLPALGGIVFSAALLLALAEIPLLLFLDPLVVFSSLCHGYSYPSLAYLGILLLLSSVFIPGLWCSKICPLGATQDFVHWPLKARKRSQQAQNRAGRGGQDRIARETRRRFLVGGMLAMFGAVGVYLGVRRPYTAKTSRVRLRPPGAREQPPFFSLCIRCGSCMAVCPTQILRPERSAANWEAFAVPYVDFSNGGVCDGTCHRCNQVCPSGAIELLTLAEKNQRKIGLAQLEMELCVLYYDQECQICKRECPYEAIDYKWSQELYCQVPVIDQNRCNGCGACRPLCPGTNHWEREEDPEVPERKAIEIVGIHG
ncbi:MAG: 4Fe-4S dicluster domain-containing protein [Planctomycetota bacterium]